MPRILADPGEDFRKLQLSLDKLQRVHWIEGLVAPTGWEVMSTFTFRWESSVDSCRRCFERWVRKRLPGVTWLYAVENNPTRYGHHIHSLWADCKGFYRKAIWQERFKAWGRARVELVRSKRDSSAYASKYLCKNDCWWNINLQWHRLQKLQGEPFSLERGGSTFTDTRLPVPQSEFPFTPETFNLFSEVIGSANGVDEKALVSSDNDANQKVLWRQDAQGLWQRVE